MSVATPRLERHVPEKVVDANALTEVDNLADDLWRMKMRLTRMASTREIGDPIVEDIGDCLLQLSNSLETAKKNLMEGDEE